MKRYYFISRTNHYTISKSTFLSHNRQFELKVMNNMGFVSC